jgi:hypothetical protein
MELIKINIGSNEGLLTIMRQLYDDHGMSSDDTCPDYKIINVDENIYWRIIKVRF